MKGVLKIFIIFLTFFLYSLSYSWRGQEKKYGISEFQSEKYLGKWYEIVRKDHKFEKGLSNVAAQYEYLGNNKIKVINSGYDEKNEKIKTAVGRAKIKYKSVDNILKVSFFWPFYADYIIMDYDREGYTYALVRGRSDKYLWVLSRTPVLDSDILESLLEKAEEDGIKLDDLIYVKHDKLQ
ncbi:lipocalin family protein [uncultured Ilyobacter sp.]|uniref:lipocalin family protein n=1 Tax=uncultured Ilyobacter sp. TaxID=544433 RepID=UPI002AA83294|nr:lipocalin family protein [uncultured Ilyobacter sp.]